MKTNVTQSSIASYDDLKSHGMAAKKALILHVMAHGKAYSRRQLSIITGLETSCIAGRVNELVKDGLIEKIGQMHCPVTGRMVDAIALSPEQMELAA